MRVDARSAGRGFVRLAMAILAVAVVACACSKGSGSAGSTPTPYVRPSSPATVAILSPTNGQVVHGSDVRIRVELTGAKIVPATTTDIVPTKGHLHVYLDDQIVSMNFKLTGDIGDVTPGMHVLRVEFVASDHLPFDPRVFTAVTFEAKR
ncbi:MAG TPA: hypothetical protein VEN95_07885 [Actinomycetota bacterium]|jgi:hypothetical protein|nr:hypothetical protein [Actinomycetota bacterium]